MLNVLAAREEKAMDEDGAMAAQGTLIPGMLDELNDGDYYAQLPPKSLSNDAAQQLVFPTLLASDNSNYDLLHTATFHIAWQIAQAVKSYPHGKEQAKLLVTGGGAFNKYLISCLQQYLQPYNVTVVVPDDNVIKYKEALVMALIGTLRWREEVNVLSTVTGATRDSVGGALWLG
jgi:anhydro-N-acetylmuramic acid kinase